MTTPTDTQPLSPPRKPALPSRPLALIPHGTPSGYVHSTATDIRKTFAQHYHVWPNNPKETP